MVDGGVFDILEEYTVCFSIRRPARKIQGRLVTTLMTSNVLLHLWQSRSENESPGKDGHKSSGS